MLKSNSKKYNISAFEEDLLCLLFNSSGLYGLEFINAITEISNGQRLIGFGSLYPALKKLERKALVESDWGCEDIGPRRKYYRLTEHGRYKFNYLQKYRYNLLIWNFTEDDVDLDFNYNLSNLYDVSLSAIEEDLLTLLLSHHEIYGAEFISAIKEASNNEYELKIGSLYTTLKRMEKKKYIVSFWGDESSGPRKKYFRMTKYGHNVILSNRAFRKRLLHWNIQGSEEDLQVTIDLSEQSLKDL